MAMATIQLRRGMLIRHQNHVYEIADFQERHTGKQKPTVHVALRDVRDGRPVDRTLNDITPINEVARAYRQLQYLYKKDHIRIFMDSETFEEYELNDGQIRGGSDFLVEGQEYRVSFIEGSPAFLDLPENIVVKITLTSPAEHSVGMASNITKEATLENGLQIRVPLFLKTGDLIRVDTRTKTYAGKEHG
jgi:elongation factor P